MIFLLSNEVSLLNPKIIEEYEKLPENLRKKIDELILIINGRDYDEPGED